jgi:hypothetical protein
LRVEERVEERVEKRKDNAESQRATEDCGK